MTCSGRRAGKVAPELISKGYCSTPKQHDYGLKLHGIAFHVPGGLPFPEIWIISPAAEHDLSALKDRLAELQNRAIYADKAYAHESLNKALQTQAQTTIFTSVKPKKGQSAWERDLNKAADDLFSKAVSAIR